MLIVWPNALAVCTGCRALPSRRPSMSDRHEAQDRPWLTVIKRDRQCSTVNSRECNDTCASNLVHEGVPYCFT
ncbi:hypothetical protein B0H13DRAFT_697517 [Mycena leptocephala]|nr:hypothetical protein B0H13DRAFT_697517 [Mycena leptocephala]